MINKDGTVVVGVKGKSGRKSARYEASKRDAIFKAWEKVLREMSKKDVEKVALPIALKDMTDKQEVKGNLKVEQITGMTIEMDAIEDGAVEELEAPSQLKTNNVLNEIKFQDKDTETVSSSKVLD